MGSCELAIGRTFGVTFDDGDDFFEALGEFCRRSGVRQGYVPMFLAGFSEAEIVGTCERLVDPGAPVWSGVHLGNVEALGCGTIAYDEAEDRILPHIHVALGLKGPLGDRPHEPPAAREGSVPGRDGGRRGDGSHDAPDPEPGSLQRPSPHVRYRGLACYSPQPPPARMTKAWAWAVGIHAEAHALPRPPARPCAPDVRRGRPPYPGSWNHWFWRTEA